MTGSKRSLHFPVLPPEPTGRAEPEIERRKPSILVVGEIGRDYLTFGEELKSLHHDESAYHGKLQVMLSALRRMEAKVISLVEEVEGHG